MVALEDNNYAFYNMLTQSVIVIARDYLTTINKMLDNFDMSLNPELFKTLEKGGFILPDNFDEIDYLKYKYYLHLFDRSILEIIFMPTLSCNFKCVYCKQVEQNVNFSKETIEKILKFVNREVKTKNKFRAVWFGGEPLLAKKDLIRMSEEFITMCDKHHCEYQGLLATNGSLLDKDFILKLNDLKIKSIQITIDGPPGEHNKLRPFANGRPSFDTIANNIEQFVELNKTCYLTLRVNVSDNNYHRIPELFDHFSEKVRKGIGHVYFHFITSSEARGYKEFVTNLNDTDHIQLYYDTLDKGWPALPSAIERMYDEDRFYYCHEADYINSFYIGPNGFLYKCSESFFPLDKEAMGYIDNQGKIVYTNFGAYLRFMMTSPFERKCRDCSVLPVHCGGCRLRRFNDQEKCIKDKDIYVDNIVKFLFYKYKTKYKFRLNGKDYRIIFLRKLN